MKNPLTPNFEIIDNAGPNNLRDILITYLSEATHADFAVAFITEAGLSEELINALQEVARRGRVRILTGLYQSFTEPKALQTLFALAKKINERFLVKLSSEEKFHPKMYLLKSVSRATVIIGSSNLTKDGLVSRGEFNVLTHFPLNSLSQGAFEKIFKDNWENRAIPIDDKIIKDYNHYRSEVDGRTRPARIPFRKIIRSVGVTPARITFWHDSWGRLAKGKTKEILSKRTSWDEKGYGWFNVSAPHHYKIGDRILLFNFYNKVAQIVEVKDLTKVATPEGDHFVVFKRIQGFVDRKLKKINPRLRSIGIKSSHEEGVNRRRISREKWEKLLGIFRRI